MSLERVSALEEELTAANQEVSDSQYILIYFILLYVMLSFYIIKVFFGDF